MGEIISAILKFIVDLEGKRFWKLVVWGVIVVVIVLALESETHFLVAIGNKNDIEVVSMLLELEKKGILESDNLKDDYLDLVEGYQQQRHFAILPAGVFKVPSSPQEQIYKFVSGTLLFDFIGLAYVFSAKKVSLGNRIGGFVLMLFLACILGVVSVLIPTFRSPWVNYIGMPILQLVLLSSAAIVSALRKGSPKSTGK
jgi:hypothetical protein